MFFRVLLGGILVVLGGVQMMTVRNLGTMQIASHGPAATAARAGYETVTGSALVSRRDR